MKPPTYSTVRLIGELRKTLEEHRNAIKNKETEKVIELTKRIKALQQELDIPFNESEFSSTA